ncbi:MAG: hypothetical protein R3A44_23755 [Caldilineaceae bacterium]
MQRTTMNATGGLFLLGLLVVFGVMVWGRNPQAAVTIQSPLPTAPADPIANVPCLTASDAGFVFDFDGYVHNEDGTTVLTYRVTNPNKKDISYVAFGTGDWARVEPNDSVTTTLELGIYQVEWTKDKGNPGFTSIKYETHFGGYSQGATDTFTMTVGGFDPSQPIALEAKAGKDKGRVSITLADPACDRTPPPPPPFSPLPTPTPTPEGGAILPTAPQVAECIFEPPAGGMPPEEPIIPPSAYSFSEPTLVLTSTAPMGIEQWLPDNETLLVTRRQSMAEHRYAVDLVDSVTGSITQIVEPRLQLKDPKWVTINQSVIWRETSSPEDNEPGYWLRSLQPAGQIRLAQNAEGASIAHDVSSDGKQVVFMSLPGGTQPLLWNQETKTLRALPVDLNNWRYSSGDIYFSRPFNINWQPSGDKILFWDGTWVFLYDLTTNRGCEIKVNAFIASQNRFVQAASWSPNGRYLLLKNAEYPLYSMLDGSHDLVLLLDTYTGEGVQYALGNTVYSFSWAPDNQTVAVVKKTERQIQMADGGVTYRTGMFLFNIHNGAQQQILPIYSATSEHGLAWSPDGAWLAFLGSALDTSGNRGLGGVQVSRVTIP